MEDSSLPREKIHSIHSPPPLACVILYHQEDSPTSTMLFQSPLEEHINKLISLSTSDLSHLTLVTDNAHLSAPSLSILLTSPSSASASASATIIKSSSPSSFFLSRPTRALTKSVSDNKTLLMYTPKVKLCRWTSESPPTSNPKAASAVLKPPTVYNRANNNTTNSSNKRSDEKSPQSYPQSSRFGSPYDDDSNSMIRWNRASSLPVTGRGDKVYLRQNSDSVLIRPERRGSNSSHTSNASVIQ